MGDKQATDDEKRETLDKLVKQTRFVMFTTAEADGKLVSRPMTVQERDERGNFVFISQAGNDVAVQSDGKPVNLTFVADGSYVSVSGTGRVVDDVEKKKDLWNTVNDAFAEGGPEDPNNVLIVVDGDTAEYWDSPNGVITLVGVLKAKVAGGRPEGGDHDTVNL